MREIREFKFYGSDDRICIVLDHVVSYMATNENSLYVNLSGMYSYHLDVGVEEFDDIMQGLK